jgi:hypothetical protein
MVEKIPRWFCFVLFALVSASVFEMTVLFSMNFLCQKANDQVGFVVHTCNPRSGGRGRRLPSLRPTQANVARPYLKNKTIRTKRLGT